MPETRPETDPRLREILEAFAASQFDDITVHCAELRLRAVKEADGAVRIVDADAVGGESPAA